METKWRFLTILRNIFNLERWRKGQILKSVACMMYVEHVLRVRVDWSSLGPLNEKKFGGIGIAFTKCTVPDIPYIPVPEWFRENSRLVDDPSTPIPDGRKPKRSRHSCRADNDMETISMEVVATMEDGMKDTVNQENIAKIEVNNLINEVGNEVNLDELGEDTLESKMEEFRKQHAEKIREFKARVLELKNQVTTLTIEGAGSSSSAPITTTDNTFQSLQVERDTTLEEIMITKSQILEVVMMNQVMQSKMEALQKEVVDIHQQLQGVNEIVVNYKTKIDLDILGQLEEQNGKLKKYLLDAIVERNNMRTCTLFAMAKARSFEAEFESFQKEWNRNQKMRNMMLISWSEDEQMYPSWWDECNWTLPSGNIDRQQVPNENHH